jgi:catechol 2,3-dioxygenase-like lactoylglutathione lyase family enzyme
MQRTIGAISLLVRDYDEAISFYVGKLGFTLIEDTDMGGGKRWILVSPRDSAETLRSNSGQACLLLAKAASPEQGSRIGNQTGGRVFLFLHTDDFRRDYEALKANGVRILEEPRNQSYGTVVVFEDLYGNKWDLLEMRGRK